MLKYCDTKVVFREIPDEITLAINISGCPCKCEGCHSSYLTEDIGTELNEDAIIELINLNDSVSCISFMGGDNNPCEVSHLAKFIKSKFPKLAIGWYSGRDELSKEVDITYFNYIKIGSYQSKLGPLDCETTNQRIYKVTDQELVDITYKMRKISL